INFGVGGTGTWQQSQMFHIKARKYKPDVTVLAFCWCNDVGNNIDKFKSGDRSPLLDEYEIGWLKVLQA
ncbi:MAG TPA: lipolytic protein G-D-S-L family, partial [Nitrospina sp.]|nr:lipolytic protein G-D-S-L family [Nitrospina sp.]